MGGALDAQEHQKGKMQRSRFALETLLGLILKAHHGLEGFPNGFGRALKRASLKNLIFKGCLQRNHYFWRFMGPLKPS